MKKMCIWFYMLTKRLFFRWSFLVLLLLIPLLLPAANTAMQGDSGVLRIALCREGAENPGATEIIQTLLREESILRYSEYPSVAEARRAVEQNRADAAWVFAEDFNEAIGDFAAHRTLRPAVTVLERESGIALKRSYEKLYGAIYPHVARAAYRNFVETEFSENVSLAAADGIYDETAGGGSVVRVEKLHRTAEGNAGNFLTAPLRGLLSLVVMLCGMAACMYYLEDRRAGRFDWLPVHKQILPAIAISGAALLLAMTAMTVALYAAGNGTGFWNEIAGAVLFVLSATGFCTVLALLFRKPGTLGAALPAFLLMMLTLSPIFFNTKLLFPFQLLLPTYYYLQAIYNPIFLLYMLFYCVGAGFLIYVLNFLLFRDGLFCSFY